MPFFDLAQTPRKVQRLTEMASVLVRHGLSYLVHRLNLGRYLPKRKQIPSPGDVEVPDRAQTARRLVKAMEELGPAFVRLGQLLASRPDLLHEEYIHEFERLQDHVAPFPSAEARAVVEREFGQPLGALFASFEDEPAASGSLAQVHHALLQNGREVVVKIKRPGVERVVLTDLSLLRPLAEYAARQFPDLAMFQPAAVIDELERTVRRELDFVTEAANTANFGQNLGAGDGARCPQVIWELTSPAVFTMERLHGARITDVAAIEALGLDRRAIAHRLASLFLKQYLQLGAFHADPHPGNLLVLADGTIGILDWGSVGRFTDDLRDKLGMLLVAVARREVEVVSEICFALRLTGDDFNEAAFQRGILELLDKWYGMPLKRVDARRLFHEVVLLARECHVLLPRDFVLFAKSLATIVGIGRVLDPDFEVSDLFRARARGLVRERLSPTRIAKSAGLSLWSFTTLLQSLPRSLLRILRRTEAGNLQITFRHTGHERFVTELDRSANRITLALILGSIVIGSSLLLALRTPPLLYGSVSLVGIFGYLIAGVLGLWTVWGILRSGRL